MNLKKLQNLPNTSVGKLLNLVGVLRGYSPLFPRFVEFLLTYRCNLDCEFCYQAKEKRELFPDMSIEDAKLIERNIRKSFHFKPRIHLFGGEPTVNKDFVKILNYYSEKNYKISITTNGIDMDKYVKDLTTTKGLVEINMSLNTMNFEKSLLNLQLLKKCIQGNGIYINLACPINIINQTSLLGIVKRFQNSYANCITFQHTTLTDNYKVDMDFNGIKSQVEEIKKTRYKIPVLFLPDIKPKDIRNYYKDTAFPYSKNKCIFPWFVLFIQPNGNVIPCDEMDVVMGNAKEESLKKIWNNQRNRRFRQDIQKYGVSHPICKRCCHRQYY